MIKSYNGMKPIDTSRHRLGWIDDVLYLDINCIEVEGLNAKNNQIVYFICKAGIFHLCELTKVNGVTTLDFGSFELFMFDDYIQYQEGITYRTLGPKENIIALIMRRHPLADLDKSDKYNYKLWDTIKDWKINGYAASIEHLTLLQGVYDAGVSRSRLVESLSHDKETL